MARRYEMDICSGKIAPKILTFAIPLMLTSLLQLLYNAVDVIVVGRFVGDTALSAVGSTSSLISLIVNAFVGLSVGACVILAQSIGAGDYDKIHKVIHTAFTISALIGVFLAILGGLICKPLLQLMGSPDNVIDQAALYMKIYFLGMPGFMVCTFGSAIMRTFGDTRRPLMFLSISGLLNVFLNLISVVVFHMGVAGVAIATIASQYLSALLVVLALMKSEGSNKLYMNELKIYGKILMQMMKIGLPLSIQYSIFSISNVLIQSSVNSFGSDVMAGNAAASSIENFLYVAMNAFSQAASTFVAQNFGAQKYKRVYTSLKWCLFFALIVGAFFGPLLYFYGEPLIKIYCPENTLAVQYGIVKLKYVCSLYALCGVMEVLAGSIQGTGATLPSMLVSAFGICGVRIVWILTVFRSFHTLPMLFVAYPISWSVTAVIHLFSFFYIKRKKFKPKELSAKA